LEVACQRKPYKQ